MADEQWKPVSGFNDYEVSDLGNVRSLRKRRSRAWIAGVPIELKRTPNNHGYLQVSLYSDERKCFTIMVHKLVATAFHGPCPEGLQCRHVDGNKDNCRADNLKYGTKIENEHDKARHGTVARGSRDGNSKLTEQDAALIMASPDPHSKVASEFGVSEAAVANIRMRKTWKHVEARVSYDRSAAQARGERMGGAAKLTTEQVLAIRSDIGSIRALGRKYGVSGTQILKIRRRESWSHL